MGRCAALRFRARRGLLKVLVAPDLWQRGSPLEATGSLLPGVASLPGQTLALITILQPDRVVLVGGTGVMSTGIQTQLTNLGGHEVVREPYWVL